MKKLFFLILISFGCQSTSICRTYEVKLEKSGSTIHAIDFANTKYSPNDKVCVWRTNQEWWVEQREYMWDSTIVDGKNTYEYCVGKVIREIK